VVLLVTDIFPKRHIEPTPATAIVRSQGDVCPGNADGERKPAAQRGQGAVRVPPLLMSIPL